VEPKGLSEACEQGDKKDLCTRYRVSAGIYPYLVAHTGRVVLKDVFTAYDMRNTLCWKSNFRKLRE
jgi:hypothetical protein